MGEGMDMLLSLSRDKSTPLSFTARRLSVECYSAEHDSNGLTSPTKNIGLRLQQAFACLSPFGDNKVRQELVKLLPLHVHRRYFHVSLKHLAADGLTVHCVYKAKTNKLSMI